MSNETFYKIKLDLVQNISSNFIHVMQYDDNGSYIRAEIYKNWQLVPVNDKYTKAEIRMRKPDGKVLQYSTDDDDPVIFIEDDCIKINIVEQMTVVSGNVSATIKLYDLDGHIQTAIFVMTVDFNPVQESEQSEEIKKSLESRVETLEANLPTKSDATNLENGEGEFSLRQKTSFDRPTPISGNYSIELGESIVLGRYSIGEGALKYIGRNDYAVGSEDYTVMTTYIQKALLAIKDGLIAKSSYLQSIGLTPIPITDSNWKQMAIALQLIVMHTGKSADEDYDILMSLNVGSNSLAINSLNFASDSIVTGESVVKGDNNLVSGWKNVVRGDNHIIAGVYNFILGNLHAIFGRWNATESGSEGIFLSGSANRALANKKYGGAVGYDLVVGRNAQFVVGHNNVGKSNTLFEVGKGSNTTPTNAFEILDDGRAKVYGAPTENNDVVRYQDKATTSTFGLVKPDGTTITINNGIISASNSGGTTNYNDLSNKPMINNVALTGNKSFSDLGLIVETVTIY